MKKRDLISVLTIMLIALLFILTGCSENKKEENTVVNNITNSVSDNNIDYLVLVNKKNKLPDDWEEKVDLVTVKDAWGDDIQVERQAYEKYKELKAALEKEQVYIELDSCYRSVAEQQELWDSWTVEKGIEYVKTYVAVPGFSEHHTGLALDICIRVNGELVFENEDMIADRETFAKIHAKLADYGFILRYLENRDEVTGYSYEPWHLRYVGSSNIAKEIMSKNITLEEYLESVKQ